MTTTPIILHAEAFEDDGHHHGARPPSNPTVQPAAFIGSPVTLRHQISESHSHAEGSSAWNPSDGLERALFTVLTNCLVGVGFALLIVAGYALRGGPMSIGVGILWGAGGFVVFTLAPGLGLPPEVPGALTADLAARQLWWVFAVVGAALGLSFMVFMQRVSWKVLGAVAMVIPHLAGAPRPDSIGGSVPPEIAGQFVAASIAVSAIFWVMLGSLSAAFYRRFA